MKCLVAGASGLVGQELVNQLLADVNFDEVTVIVRTVLKQQNPKLKAILVPSFDQVLDMTMPPSDVAFCSLGSTIKKAGSKEAFYKVDHDYIVNFAKSCFKSGVKTFIVVSALGADPHSKVFYNQVKGQTEQDLKNIGFTNLFILQPSLLMGDRIENRPAEKIAQGLTKFLNPLMVGPLVKIKPIKASQVAARMIKLAKEKSNQSVGFKLISNESI